MTRRATFTQAELTRAIRAAKGEGLVPVLTPLGMAFVESSTLALPSPAPEPEPAPFDDWMARREAKRAGRP